MSAIKTILCILGILALCAFSFCLGRRRQKEVIPETYRDTVIISSVDTLTVEKPTYFTSRITDTIYVPIRETDTLYVKLPFEEREYRDSLYRALVSGYMPSLDLIEIYPRTETKIVTIQTEKKVKTKWGLGVQAGYGFSANGVSPYVGIGISYNLVNW